MSPLRFYMSDSLLRFDDLKGMLLYYYVHYMHGAISKQSMGLRKLPKELSLDYLMPSKKSDDTESLRRQNFSTLIENNNEA